VETSSYLNKDYVSPFEPKFYQVSRATAQSQSVTPHSPFALPTSNSLSLSFSQTQTLYPPPPSPPPPLSLTHIHIAPSPSRLQGPRANDSPSQFFGDQRGGE